MDFHCLLLIVEIFDKDKMYFKRKPKTMIEKRQKLSKSYVYHT